MVSHKEIRYAISGGIGFGLGFVFIEYVPFLQNSYDYLMKLGGPIGIGGALTTVQVSEERKLKNYAVNFVAAGLAAVSTHRGLEFIIENFIK